MKEYKNYHGNGQISHHYWLNVKGNAEGEYKEWWNSGQPATHCFFKNGLWNGEFKCWHSQRQILQHYFFHNNEVVDITEYVTDVNNITEEEYFLLQMTFGYFPIIKFDGTEHERN